MSLKHYVCQVNFKDQGTDGHGNGIFLLRGQPYSGNHVEHFLKMGFIKLESEILEAEAKDAEAKAAEFFKQAEAAKAKAAGAKAKAKHLA